MKQHAQLKTNADLGVYFCDPHGLWQRHKRKHKRIAAPNIFQKLTI